MGRIFFSRVSKRMATIFDSEKEPISCALPITNRTVTPSGRISGQRYESSFLLTSGAVRISGEPPAAETRIRPPNKVGAKVIVLSGPQVALRLMGASQSVVASPPLTEAFFSLPSAKNPTHWPSGEKNGLVALVEPGRGCDSRRSTGRKKSCVVWPCAPKYAILVPSREIATAGKSLSGKPSDAGG